MHKSIVRDKAKALGLKRYFTGEPCPKGHVADRFVSSFSCVVCADERRRQNADYHANYRSLHRDKVKTTNGEYYAANAAQLREYARAYRKENAEAVRAKDIERDKGEARSIAKRESVHRRRAIEGKYGREDIRKLLKAQNGRCIGCAIDIATSYHIDHIQPLSRGGTNWPDNLQLLCRPCNQSKGFKTMAEWRQR